MPPFADVLQWEHLPFPKSLRDFQRLFATDEACARYLECKTVDNDFDRITKS
jgi:hypothetical protein